MSTTQPHSCETNNCNGSRYYGWSLNCRFCGKKIFVECLRQLDELRTKELLHAFELMSKTVRSDGTFEWKILSDKPSKYSEFLQMFSADSIFGITCHCCATKFNKITTEVEHREVSIQRLSEEIVKSVNKSIQNKLNNGLIDLGASSSASHSDNKNTNPKKTPGPQKITPINGIYSIHVSRLPKDATSDDVTAIIIANSEIHTDAFSVEKIPNKRFKGNSRNFSSFKISTLSHEVCNKIITLDDWDPNYIVKPFIHPVKKQSDGTAQKKNKQNAEKKRTTQHNSDNNNNRQTKGKPNAHFQREQNDNQRKTRYSNRNHRFENFSRPYNHNRRFQNQNVYSQRLSQWQQSAPFLQQPFFHPPYVIPGLQQMHHHPSQIPMQMPQHLPPQMLMYAQPQPFYHS